MARRLGSLCAAARYHSLTRELGELAPNRRRRGPNELQRVIVSLVGLAGTGPEVRRRDNNTIVAYRWTRGCVDRTPERNASRGTVFWLDPYVVRITICNCGFVGLFRGYVRARLTRWEAPLPIGTEGVGC